MCYYMFMSICHHFIMRLKLYPHSSEIMAWEYPLLLLQIVNHAMKKKRDQLSTWSCSKIRIPFCHIGEYSLQIFPLFTYVCAMQQFQEDKWDLLVITPWNTQVMMNVRKQSSYPIYRLSMEAQENWIPDKAHRGSLWQSRDSQVLH